MNTISPTIDSLREQHEQLKLRHEIVEMERAINLADLESRVVLRESEQWGDLVNRREYLSDTPGFGFGGACDNRIASPSDRKDGKCSPIFENEQDLAWIRGVGRFIADHYEVAIGALENLTSYTIGTGFTYEAQERRGRKAPKGLAAAVQEAIDETAEANSWEGDLESELFKRASKEGEFFLWVRESGIGPASFTLVDPGFVTEPHDVRRLEDYLDLEGLCWSFGIASDQGNAERRRGYFVQWDGDAANWDFAPAASMVHCRLNVDRGVKRGISDFYAAYQNLERSSKLLGNTLQGAAIQASIAYIREHMPGTSEAAITSFRNTKADSSFQASKPGGGSRTQYQQKILPGRVIDTQGTKYHAGPLGQSSAPTYIDVMQAGLRIVGARWTMPEYMISGDASNANYSSTLVAGGPFDRATKRRQAFYTRHYSAAFWMALGIYCRQGRFRQYGIYTVTELRDFIELDIEAPGVAIQDDAAQETIRETRFRNGVLSRRTWAAQADLDFDVEEKNGAAVQDVAGQPMGIYPPSRRVNDAVNDANPITSEVDARLNGAQITATVEVLNGVRAGTTAKETAIELLKAVGIDDETARRMVASTLTDTKPVTAPQSAVAAALESVRTTEEARAILMEAYP